MAAYLQTLRVHTDRGPTATMESRCGATLEREESVKLGLQSPERKRVSRTVGWGCEIFWAPKKMIFKEPGNSQSNQGWAGLTESVDPTGFDRVFPIRLPKRFSLISGPLLKLVPSQTGWTGRSKPVFLTCQ